MTDHPFDYVSNVPVKILVEWGAQNCKTDDLKKRKKHSSLWVQSRLDLSIDPLPAHFSTL